MDPNNSNPLNGVTPGNAAPPTHTGDTSDTGNQSIIQPTTSPLAEQPAAQPTTTFQSTISPTAIGQIPNQPNTPVTPTNSSAIPSIGQNQPSIPTQGPLMNGQPTPTPGSTGPSPNGFNANKHSAKKTIIISALAAVTILAGIGGYVFGLYIPNTPNKVWSSGLSRTGKQLDAAIDKLSDPKSMETLARSQLTMTGKYTDDQGTITGNANSKYDTDNTDSTLEVNIKHSSLDDIKIGLDIKTQIIEGSIWPNAYLRVSGLESIGLEDYVDTTLFNNKWVSIEQDDYKDVIGDLSGSTENSEATKNITQDEVIALTKEIAAVTNEYVFTSDSSKAVIQADEFIGTEDSEGIKANKYKASINSENSVAYCKALNEKVNRNATVQKLFLEGKNIDDEIKKGNESCEKESESTKKNQETQELEIWVDRKYKLLHKVRATDKSKNSESGTQYYEYGQIYSGEEELKIFANSVSDKAVGAYELRSSITVNTNDLSVSGKITYQSKQSSGGKFEGEIKTEPYSGDIDSNKPEGAISITQLLEQLSLSGGAQQPTPVENDEWSFEDYEEFSEIDGESLGATTQNDTTNTDPIQSIVNQLRTLLGR